MNRFQNFVRGFGGYILDMMSVGRKPLANPHQYTKFLIINFIRKRTGARIFIETGTYHGVTTARCAKYFERIYTIELDPTLAEMSRRFLACHKNIKLIQGDATKVLQNLMGKEDIKEVLIFLDGHFSGGVTACGDEPEPAISLLRYLAMHRDKICAIVIDDFRTFGMQHGVPQKSTLLKTAEEHFALYGYALYVNMDQLIISRN